MAANVQPIPEGEAPQRNLPGIQAWGPFLLYGAIVILTFPLYRYWIGPDAISYISIARHYLDGYWAEAVNTNWSPVYSWLMIPLLAAGVAGLTAAKIICILSGAVALYAIRRLARGFGLHGAAETGLLYTAALLLAAYAMVRVSPDMTVAAILLLYFGIVFDRDYPNSRRAALACGALGAAGFLTKGYLLYFFIAHFPLMTALHWLRARRATAAVRNFAVGMAIFILASAPWIGLMSTRAGKLSAGTTGAWNYRLVGPDAVAYPQYYGLIAPPGPHAASMWELPDPSLLPRWTPLDSKRALLHQIKLILINVKLFETLLIDISVLSVAALLAYCIWGLAWGRGERYAWYAVAATAVLLPAGYLLILIQDRYIYAVFLLALLSGGVVLQHARVHLTPAAWRIALAVFALSFAVLPLRLLAGQRHSGRPLYEASRFLSDKGTRGERMASCGSWNDSAAIAFHLHAPFYGATGATPEEEALISLNPSRPPVPPPPSPEQVAQQLRQHAIVNYLVWPSCRVLPPASMLANEVAVPGTLGLKLYRVSKDIDIH